MFTRENIRVTLAAIFGFSAPGVNWVIDFAEPLMKVLVLGGQLGVAIVTICYIYRKWKNVGKK
jgi:hypothetical protein